MMDEQAIPHPEEDVPRNRWVRSLLTVPDTDVLTLADDLATHLTVEHRAIPRSGLMLMRMQESVLAEDYYLGELSVSSAWVALTDASGTTVQGAAQIMEDHQDLAIAIAICDGVLAHRLEGWESVDRLVRTGAGQLDEEHRVRKAMLARTRVDFSLVSEDAEE